MTEVCREITQDEIDTYARDGVVCLRQAFDPAWTEKLLPAAKRITVDHEDVGLLPTYPGRYMSRTVQEFRDFIFQSSMAEAAARVIGSTTAAFFFDEMFAKAPKSTDATIWHCDRMGWPTSGVMVPSIWIPLSSISKENCLECIAESQHQDVPYWLFSPNARQMIKPDDRVSHPDGDKLRADPDNKFLQWDMEPGDMLVLHPWTLHYSHGNTDDDWRIALSLRIFGDDIRWKPRPDCLNIAGVSFDEMIEGEIPGGTLFPRLWSADGSKDTDEHYPRGFATQWSTTRRDTINEDEEFNKRLKASRT